MMIQSVKYLLAIWILLGVVLENEGFRMGDLIKTSKKNFNIAQGSSVPWMEVLSKYCPRFGQRKTVYMPLLKDQLNLQIRSDIKIAFAFDNTRFITPLLTVTDSAGNFLEVLTFTFTYSGDDILDFQYHTHYATEPGHENIIPSFLAVTYEFETYAEQDIEFALSAFQFVGFLMGVSLLMFVIIDSQSRYFSELSTNTSTSTSTSYSPPPVHKQPSIPEYEAKVIAKPGSSMSITKHELSSSDEDDSDSDLEEEVIDSGSKDMIAEGLSSASLDSKLYQSDSKDD